MSNVTIVGRSSSHYTRTARIFAIELGVAHAFRPVLDMSSLNAADYADNPALKVPILVDEHGALFGTENICRELARRAGGGAKVVLRGAVRDRVVANAEELTLHAMSAEVTLILAKIAGDARLAPPKVVRSLENALDWLDRHVDAVADALPADRQLSFVETALFAVVTHLPFREVLDVSRWTRLGEHARKFGERASARATEYRYDTA
jgi:glutathione S-transferase